MTHVAVLAIIAYLVFGSGAVSDDFTFMVYFKEHSFRELLFPETVFINMPFFYYTHGIGYHFVQPDNLLLFDLIKVFYIVLAVYLTAKFFSIFLEKQNALLASFLFVFFPSHDATVYCYITHHLILTISLSLYCFYLLHNNRLQFAMVISFLASFVSYGSSVISFSLTFYFVLNKEIRKGMIIFLPNVIFIMYYLFATKRLTPEGANKIPETLSLLPLLKQFVLQLFTFLDAAVGPSLWMKMYYSYTQLTVLSLLIGGAATLIFYFYPVRLKYGRAKKTAHVALFAKSYDLKLIMSLAVLVIGTFCMFSVTGMYPQLAFNLGNRTTIYGSLLLTYLLVALPVKHSVRTIFFSILFLSILGISDHWKSWTIHQKAIVENIAKNSQLVEYNLNKPIFVTGNQYSKLGPFSHIEFLSEDWVVNSIFQLAGHKNIIVKSLNKRFVVSDNSLFDLKNKIAHKIDGSVIIYDSEEDHLYSFSEAEVTEYLLSLPRDNRHWLQMINNSFVTELVLSLMPRLRYAF